MMLHSASFLNILHSTETPFYFYDLSLLHKTIRAMQEATMHSNFQVHYALKANSNEHILRILKGHGLGADCVSGNEISKALETGFEAKHIVFAGVGKTDQEIELALNKQIFCFNVESIQEIEVMNEIAKKMNKVASIALRINPNVDANTHHFITTGLEENKFGINLWELDAVLNKIPSLKNLELIGIHFHIGSQITDLTAFRTLCLKANEIQKLFERKNIPLKHINVGGGLGINYQEPDADSIADFDSYFSVFKQHLEVRQNQEVHFELGRAIVGTCGSLISKVLYIKTGINTNFIILDAGMTELIRPALYQSFHKIENLTVAQNAKRNTSIQKRYDVVGPICESSDCFAKAMLLPESQRGDIIAIRSTGAYGEVMASNYNLRVKAKAIYL